MDLRRLAVLVQLARLGSMREVADELGLSTSTVSQQIAALAREVGTPLIEPDGRRVRLTAAGRRLADHAVRILAAVEAAVNDLDPDAVPAGEVRTCAFQSGMRRHLIPLVHELARSHPDVRVLLREGSVVESLAALRRNQVDLALVFDFDLAPLVLPDELVSTPLWTVPWSLAVPAGDRVPPGPAPEVVAHYRDAAWIVDSRDRADEEALRVLTAMAGFEPRVEHRVDDLALVAELVGAGLGVALLPADRDRGPDVGLVELSDPQVLLRGYAVHRVGAQTWAPLRVVLEQLSRCAEASGSRA